MADFDSDEGRIIGIYALALGIAYLVIGMVEVFGGAGTVVPGDLFGGFALVVIAATYFNGVRGVVNGDHRGLSFVVGGLFLTAVFGFLYLLLMVADGLMFLLGEAEEFSALADFRPAIMLFFLALPLAYKVRELTQRVTW